MVGHFENILMLYLFMYCTAHKWKSYVHLISV